MANSVDPDHTAPIGVICSGSTLFASILNLSVMLVNYMQQTTSADDIFRCIFFFCALRVNIIETQVTCKMVTRLCHKKNCGQNLITVLHTCVSIML